MPDEFEPLNWQSGPGGGTPITPTNLNRMEAGIEAADDRLDALGAPTVHVDSYPNVFPNGEQDSGAGIQAAIDDAASNGKRLVFGEAVYKTSVELVFGTTPASLYEGAGGRASRTVIRATAAVRSVCRVSGALSGYAHVQGIKFDANRLATYGMWLNGSAQSSFTDVFTEKAVKDGVKLAKYFNVDEGTTGTLTNNNHIIWTNCWSNANGTLYVTSAIAAQMFGQYKVTAGGTVATTANSQTITGTGTSFTTMGIRPGDLIRIGETVLGSDYCQILTVDSDTQITVGVRKPPAVTASSRNFAIGVGDGYREERHGDNNIAIFIGGLYRNNGGSGQFFNGLYGPNGLNCQVDLNGMAAVVVGRMDNAAQVHRSSFIGYYLEALSVGFYLGFAEGFVIANTLYGDNMVPFVVNYVANQVAGLVLGPGQGTGDLEMISASGVGAFSNLPQFGFCRPSHSNHTTELVTIGTASSTWYYRVVEGGRISKVRIYVGTSSGNISVAAYANTGTGSAADPGTQLATSGSGACPAAGARDVSLGKTITVRTGDWLAIAVDNLTATFAGITGVGAGTLNEGMSYQQTTSAFPCPTTPSGLVATNVRLVGCIGLL